MTLLYIMGEYPSVSQTFVENEAAAVNALGIRVVGYTLRRGAATRATAEIDLILPPPSRLRLFLAGVASGRAIVASLWQARRERFSYGEVARLLLAEAHAANAVRASKQAGVTHIHAHFLGRSADVASLLAARLGCKWSATAHGTDVYAPPEPNLLRRRLRTVTAVSCANRGVQEGLERLAAPREIPTATVHCGVDTRALRFSAPRTPAATRHIVTVGRLVVTKGHWTILDSALALMRRDDSLRWTIVGDGPLREALTQDVRYIELTPRLTFAGPKEHPAVLALIAESAVCVLPCEQGTRGDSDGIPVALMEAMALGVPVVTTAIGGIPELVIPDVTGFVVAPKDAQGLADTLERILYKMEPSDLERIREAARSKVEREFDLSAEAAALVELLRRHVGNDQIRRLAEHPPLAPSLTTNQPRDLRGA